MKNVVLYARVSTDKQNVDSQLLELRKVVQSNGWTIVKEYVDEGISGKHGRDKRPQFDQLLKDAVRKKFDVVMCWDISRLGRSLQDLINFLNDIQSKSIDLYIHQQGLDTSTTTGRLMFSLVGCFAEYERNIISERVKSGLRRAVSDGKKLGRPTNVNDGSKSAVKLLREKGLSINKIAKELSIGVGTIYSILDPA